MFKKKKDYDEVMTCASKEPTKVFVMDVVRGKSIVEKYKMSDVYELCDFFTGYSRGSDYNLLIAADSDTLAVPSPWLYHQCYKYALKKGWIND